MVKLVLSQDLTIKDPDNKYISFYTIATEEEAGGGFSDCSITGEHSFLYLLATALSRLLKLQLRCLRARQLLWMVYCLVFLNMFRKRRWLSVSIIKRTTWSHKDRSMSE